MSKVEEVKGPHLSIEIRADGKCWQGWIYLADTNGSVPSGPSELQNVCAKIEIEIVLRWCW